MELKRLGFFARLFTRLVYWATRRQLGKALLSQKIAAHSPYTFAGRTLFEGLTMASHALDARLKTLVSLRTGMLVGCPH